MSRIPRGVLAPAAAIAVLAFLIAAGYGLQAIFGSSTPAPLPTFPGAGTQLNASPNPVVAENAKPGTTAWRITNVAGSAGIEGYADHTSAQQGDTVTLYVSTSAAHFSVQAYRMGYYGGLGGRLVWTSPTEAGTVQAGAAVQAGTNMASAPWKASLAVHIDAAWSPGDYLLKLVGDGGQQRYVPLTIDTAPNNSAPLLIVNAVTTWEAFNDWGGYNLYYGPNQAAQNRSTVVSFDRPYASAGSGDESGDGSGDFLGDEFPLVYFAESYGLNVAYVTDVDLDEHGVQLLAGRSGVITLGHDEYWTQAMRTALTGAEAHGVNLAFLGANAMYQQIRLQPSDLGADRQIVDYKSAATDPIAASDPSEVTGPWRDPPVSQPESSVIGQLFECNPAAPAPAVVVDSGNWLFADTGIRNGDTFPKLIGPYYDRVDLRYATPANVEVLAHSPVTCQGVKSDADMTYYSAPSGAGVFATGTTGWVCELTASCLQDPRSHPDERILRITKTLLSTFAQGPAGTAHPSKSNLASLGITKSSP